MLDDVGSNMLDPFHRALNNKPRFLQNFYVLFSNYFRSLVLDKQLEIFYFPNK